MTEAGDAVWPARAPYALCLTHDVDRVRKQAYHYAWYGMSGGLSAAATQLRSLGQRLLVDEPYWNFDRIMRTEDRLGVRSTVLFLHETSKGRGPAFWGRYDLTDPRVCEAARTLDRGGWEVGLHGSFHSFGDIDLLRSEKALIEDIIGKAVRSTRQHHLNLRQPETWRIQREIGLEIDSTLGSSTHPWRPEDGVLPYYVEPDGVLELPITIMDTIGLGDPAVRRRIDETVDGFAQAGGLIVLDWHQRTWSPHEYPDAVQTYEAIVRRAQDDGAWIATMSEIADHWAA